MNYWQFGDYLGIGAGAHGKISAADSGQIVRRWKHKHPAKYLAASSQAERIGGETAIPTGDSALEFMMNALRLIEGFPIPLFELHTGTSLMQWQGVIEEATQKGLLEQQGLNLKATPTGINWLNSLLELFLESPTNQPNHPGTSPTMEEKRYPIIPLNIVKK